MKPDTLEDVFLEELLVISLFRLLDTSLPFQHCFQPRAEFWAEPSQPWIGEDHLQGQRVQISQKVGLSVQEPRGKVHAVVDTVQVAVWFGSERKKKLTLI